MNTPVSLHQEISVRRATHDGYIWIPARVVMMGVKTFKAKRPMGDSQLLSYVDIGKTWRIEG